MDDEQIDRHLAVLAAMVQERMEWENTLSPLEKSERRLRQFAMTMPEAFTLAAESNEPRILLGQIERMVYHACEVYGREWLDGTAEWD